MRKWVHHIQYWTLQIATQISKTGVWGGLPTCQDLGGVKQTKLETNWSKEAERGKEPGKISSKTSPMTDRALCFFFVTFLTFFFYSLGFLGFVLLKYSSKNTRV